MPWAKLSPKQLGGRAEKWKEKLRAVLDAIELIDVYFMGDRFAQYVEELGDLAHWIGPTDVLSNCADGCQLPISLG